MSNEEHFYKAERVEEMRNQYGQEQLTPYRSVDFVADTKDKQGSFGAYANLTKHPALKYNEANRYDPGALFTEARPRIEMLYATPKDRHHVPALLALAHEHAVKNMGAVPTHSNDLSPNSAPIVEKAIKKGFVIPNEFWEPTEAPKNEEEIADRKRSKELADKDAYPVVNDQVEGGRARHKDSDTYVYENDYSPGRYSGGVFTSIRNDEELARGHRLARQMLGATHPSKVSRQFSAIAPKSGEQLELF